MATPRRPLALALALALPAVAAAHQPPPRYPRLRPTVEVSSWVGLGGGALVVGDASRSVFDLRLGGDATFDVGSDGDLRVGPFVEATTSTFATVQAVAGAELFLGAAPRPLRMFHFPGEGVFSARAGLGWAWREHDVASARSSPLAALTLTYGYRAPFSLREPGDETGPEPDSRSTARYMIGARLWVGATVDLTGAPAWQLTGGIEFEPAGALRYLLGLY
ncbi:MAG: hypothetical protein Q8S73_23165 [Deltaproteobacteria bacterium]|nr:hypothetical protein [Myxococcales bacterium]MDP3217030.1 hypothetical protein [Deltaproteobacteria bacterium]